MIKRRREADPQFNQYIQGGRSSPGSNNGYRSTGYSPAFSQQYHAGSSAVNIAYRKRKRSISHDAGKKTKRDAQFYQNIQGGYPAFNSDCKASGSCSGGSPAFSQQYHAGSSAVNIDYGKRKRSISHDEGKKNKRDAQFNHYIQGGYQEGNRGGR